MDWLNLLAELNAEHTQRDQNVIDFSTPTQREALINTLLWESAELKKLEDRYLKLADEQPFDIWAVQWVGMMIQVCLERHQISLWLDQLTTPSF